MILFIYGYTTEDKEEHSELIVKNKHVGDCSLPNHDTKLETNAQTAVKNVFKFLETKVESGLH